ncbi:MAG: hybrid sensor histidine kinase/response regulator [Pseudoxanthomonas suwonensis]|nr:hybrid sensor histidine kinase/response regulator [Pseudoxanthomonas suwonensis]
MDDQSANLRVVSTLLKRRGYTVDTADSGDAALRKVREHPPDLLLLDMMMPGMDGFEVLQTLRAEIGLGELPVVFLTAAQDRDLLLRAFEAGAVDYVTKPFMPEELLARVGSHVGLKLTRDRLQRLVQEKQALVNLVAHDLKNPLSSVLFAADVLRNDGCREERVPRYLNMIHESATDALGYIRRYLETESGGSRRGEAIRGEAALNEVIEWLQQRYGLQFEARGVQLRVTRGGDDALAWIDPLVLRQVCENLITNALKYAPQSDLEFSVHNGSPGFVQLVVEDRGPGIPQLRQRELFKPFTRLSDDDPADGLSSGLGLSLARQILVDAGGGLWYEDREGGGARFVVELPQPPQ